MIMASTPVEAAPRRSPTQGKEAVTEYAPPQPITGSGGIRFLRVSTALEAAIGRASERYGVESSTLRAFALIESGGNPRASAGSYHGVYQLSQRIFRQYGGRGSIFDLDENTNVAARKLRAESDDFVQRYGRVPTALDLYMIHQQGVAGAAMHMSDPDAPAWLNMHRTGEGQMKGPKWARLAIWGNVPADERAQFPGGVDSLTSRQFMELWGRKIAKFGGYGPAVPLADLGDPT
jgi:hypothetical protein